MKVIICNNGGLQDNGLDKKTYNSLDLYFMGAFCFRKIMKLLNEGDYKFSRVYENILPLYRDIPRPTE